MFLWLVKEDVAKPCCANGSSRTTQKTFKLYKAVESFGFLFFFTYFDKVQTWRWKMYLPLLPQPPHHILCFQCAEYYLWVNHNKYTTLWITQFNGDQHMCTRTFWLSPSIFFNIHWLLLEEFHRHLMVTSASSRITMALITITSTSFFTLPATKVRDTIIPTCKTDRRTDRQTDRLLYWSLLGVRMGNWQGK